MDMELILPGDRQAICDTIGQPNHSKRSAVGDSANPTVAEAEVSLSGMELFGPANSYTLAHADKTITGRWFIR